MLERLGDDRLAVASCLPLSGAVVEDDRPSVLRWIEVVEQVSVGNRGRGSVLDDNQNPALRADVCLVVTVSRGRTLRNALHDKSII